jgi:crossover junction endodeoxyribonuclease RusA
MKKVTHRFVIEGKPKVKGRPRFTKNGRTYTDAKTREAEQHIKDSYIQSDGPVFTTPVSITVTLFNDRTEVVIQSMDCNFSSLRGDIDNYIKSILDGLHDVAFGNDKIVQQISAIKMPKIGGAK